MKEFLDRVFQLLETSAFTQGIITSILLGVDAVMLLNDRTLPEWWIQLSIGVVFFFFGGKLGVAQGRLQKLEEKYTK